ncbi:MAG: antitoxin [Alphaproteobacteria bacterium]|nr:antitoxin [Alphaproteobacteria bacterium]
MPRLSIELSAQEHRQLKARAALSGQSLKEYVLSRALDAPPDAEAISDEEALRLLTRLLAPRLAEVEAGDLVTATAEDVKQAGRARRA